MFVKKSENDSNCVILPMLLCRIQCWIIQEKHKSLFQIVKLKYLNMHNQTEGEITAEQQHIQLKYVNTIWPGYFSSLSSSAADCGCTPCGASRHCCQSQQEAAWLVTPLVPVPPLGQDAAWLVALLASVPLLTAGHRAACAGAAACDQPRGVAAPAWCTAQPPATHRGRQHEDMK